MKETNSPATRGLLRVFGLGFGLAVVIGGVVGSGIMRNPGIVAAGFPDARLVILVWLLGGLAVAVDAMPTVELGAAIPRAGGPYSLAERAFGPVIGFVVGWADWLQNVISTGFIAVACGEFTLRLGLFTSLSAGEIAVLVILACGVINWAGTHIGGASQNIGSAIKACALMLLVGALFLAHGDPAAAAAAAPPAPAFSWIAAAVALRAIHGAYGGWHAAVYFSEEVHRPERNVARATFAGIALVTGLFVLVNAAVLHVLPVGALAKSTLAVSDAADVVLGPASGKAVTAVAWITVATLVNLQVMELVRIGFAMGRNRVLPPSLERVSANGTPRVSLAVTLVACVAIVAGAEFFQGTLYEVLLNLYAPMVMVTFIVLGLASIRLRRREPDLPRPWRMPFFPLPALISIILNSTLLVLFLVSDPATGIASSLLLAGGVVLFLSGRARWSRDQLPR